MDFGSRVNLHTHTARCKHSVGTLAEYCREAEKQGVAVLGFSDHSPFLDERFHESRMSPEELGDYCRDVERAASEFSHLTILSGLEVDYLPKIGRAFYEDSFRNAYRFDYLIAGVHFLDPCTPQTDIWHPETVLTPAAVRKFVELSIETISTGLFDYLAHPDLFTACCPRWTPEIKALCRELAETSKALDVPLEINAYGLRKPLIHTAEGERRPYPWRPFWELVAECGAPMVVGADAHRPEDVWGNTADAVAFGRECGLVPANAEIAERILRRRASL